MMARDGTRRVLNEKQRRELVSLKGLRNYPATMMQMHRWMMRQSYPRAMGDPSAQSPRSRTDPGSSGEDVEQGKSPATVQGTARDAMRDR